VIALGGGMRPIYQMPKAGQMLSLIIPSRWAFEANLLRESQAVQWGKPKPAPDITCTLDTGPLVLPPGMAPSQLPAGMLASRPPGAPMSASLAVIGDSAEMSIPSYVITAKDKSGNEETCRAIAEQSYPRENPTAFAVQNRHKFGDSVSILGIMMTILTLTTIAILKKRDSEPQ
jgi:hypothetical protein